MAHCNDVTIRTFLEGIRETRREICILYKQNKFCIFTSIRLFSYYFLLLYLHS